MNKPIYIPARDEKSRDEMIATLIRLYPNFFKL